MREVTTLSRLQHINVVRYFQVGGCAGLCFAVRCCAVQRCAVAVEGGALCRAVPCRAVVVEGGCCGGRTGGWQSRQ